MPEEVKERVRRHGEGWSIDRPMNDIPRTSQYRGAYARRAHIETAWWKHVQDRIRRKELERHLAELPNGKTPGPSGLANELLKHLPRRAKRILRGIFSFCFTAGRIPSGWGAGLRCPIPKVKDWNGDLEKTRPITLLECVRKLFFRILDARMRRVMDGHPILLGKNFGFTTGLQPTDVIATVRHIIDICNLQDRYLELLLVDVRRAYDSVGTESAMRSYRRICLPEPICAILAQEQTDRRIRINTAYGPTDPFTPPGFPQGDPLAPTSWNIFYDPLLCRLNEIGRGFRLTAEGKAAWRPKHGTDRRPPVEDIDISHGTVADDLTLIAGSRDDMRALVEATDEFFQIHNIQVNAAKTVNIRRLPRAELDTADTHVMAAAGGAPATMILAKDQDFRLLGAFLRLDGKPDGAVREMLAAADKWTALIRDKAVTGDLVVYLVNGVLIPQVAYRSWGQAITRTTLRRIEARWLPTVRAKLGIPRSIPNAALFARQPYGLTHLEDAVDRQHLGALLRHLNTPMMRERGLVQHLRLLQDYWPPFDGPDQLQLPALGSTAGGTRIEHRRQPPGLHVHARSGRALPAHRVADRTGGQSRCQDDPELADGEGAPRSRCAGQLGPTATRPVYKGDTRMALGGGASLGTTRRARASSRGSGPDKPPHARREPPRGLTAQGSRQPNAGGE